MLNGIFFFLIACAVAVGAFTGRMKEVSDAGMESATTAVTLAIGLVGQMALWLGFMGVLREAGLLRALARGLRPVMVRLFPDVPADHPAMGAMIMNVAANVLGLANAATPFGLKAMGELNRLNTRPGVATNAMALFLAINTSGVAVLPLGVIAVRKTLGSVDPAGILVPSLVGTFVSTALAVVIVKLFERLPRFDAAKVALAGVAPGEPAAPAAAPAAPNAAAAAEAEAALAERPRAPVWKLVLLLGLALALAVALTRSAARLLADQPGNEVARTLLGTWMLPLLMLIIVSIGFARQVKVYEAFVAAAKEGFQIAITIIPFLVAILVAIGMFRASGSMDAFVRFVGPFTSAVGFPPEALPMALVRPLSGSGALGVMMETLKTHGPDSFVGYLVSLINGSSETTFYVLAVYFGSVQVRAMRHTVAACITSDLVGLALATALCHAFFG